MAKPSRPKRGQKDPQRNLFDQPQPAKHAPTDGSTTAGGPRAPRSTPHDAAAPVSSARPRPEKPAPAQVRVPHRGLPDLTEIESDFLDFHESHPLVLSTFIGEAMGQRTTQMQMGSPAERVRLSAKGIYEKLRTVMARFDSPTGGKYLLNNNYTALYARLAMQEQPHLRGCFKTRTRAGEQPQE